MKRMNPNRFVVSERVHYVNHVTGQELGLLVIDSVSDRFVIAKPFFGSKALKFNLDGTATWSSNLSIRHEPQPTPDGLTPEQSSFQQVWNEAQKETDQSARIAEAMPKALAEGLALGRQVAVKCPNCGTWLAETSARIAELERELQNCNDLCANEAGGGKVSDVLGRTLSQLRAQVETLTKERQQATEMVAGLCPVDQTQPIGVQFDQAYKRLIDTISSQKAQLAASEADRERLDWIENEAGRAWPFGNQFDVKFTCLAKEPFKERPTLRAAIDAARKEEAK